MPSATKARELSEEEKKKSALYAEVPTHELTEKDEEIIDFPQDNDKLMTFKYNCRTTKFLAETDNEENLDDTLDAVSRLCKENALRMRKISPPEEESKKKNW